MLTALKEQAIADLGIGNLSSEEQDKIIETFGERAFARIMRALVIHIPDEKFSEYEALAREGDTMKIQNFLKAHIPNVDQLIQNEVKEEIKDFKELAQTLGKG